MEKTLLEQCKLNLGNQEVERIVTELEQILSLVKLSGAEWLSIDAAAQSLITELGYEDLDSLEDALKCTFMEFLKSLSTIETKFDDKLQIWVLRYTGQDPGLLKPIPENPQIENSRKIIYPVTERKDLQVICVKSNSAKIVIPEIEFEIGVDEQRTTDTIWNHMSKAIFNLSLHLTQGQAAEGQVKAIEETIEQLRKCLDVDFPWTWEIHDPSGLSSILVQDSSNDNNK